MMFLMFSKLFSDVFQIFELENIDPEISPEDDFLIAVFHKIGTFFSFQRVL